MRGAGSSGLYNGSHFALNNVVAVAINYRLGILGYLASSGMQGNDG